MMQRALLAGAVLALAGCSTTGHDAAWSELQSNPREFFNLNPPVRVAAGEPLPSPVVLKQGQALIVRVPEDPSTGYTWRMRPFPRGTLVAPVDHDYTLKPGADPGTGGEATFRMRGVAAGTQVVTLDYVRPGFTTPERSIAFDVTVR